MNILIDIGHPAHVHLFRNLYFELLKKRHNLHVTVKSNLNSAIDLLNYYKIPYISIGSKSDNLAAKVIKQISYDYQVLKIAKKNEIEIGIGTSMNLAHASKFTKMVSILLDDDDDEVQPLFTKFAHPFSDHLLTPKALINHRKSKNTIFYNGYHELAYLHPKYFSPDPLVFKEVGLNENDIYFVLRFNSFKAHHDVGAQGLSINNKRELINTLKPNGKIFITSESELEPEFQKYQIKLDSYKIHSFLFYSTIFIGDSQTMTSEAAILGVPAIKCNSFAGKLSVPNELEKKYQLCYSYLPKNFRAFIQKIEELLKMKMLKKEWLTKRSKLLRENIDVTLFLIWLVENYPRSITEYYNNSQIQNKFK